jgi:hypothetical protein
MKTIGRDENHFSYTNMFHADNITTCDAERSIEIAERLSRLGKEREDIGFEKLEDIP